VEQYQLTTQNENELAHIDSLTSHWNDIPAVIKDAIKFVIGCEERYLWVDSLCIVQDDKSKKYAQIQQMGAIYNSAIATLVAGTGESANAPLAGIRPSTRIPETLRPKYHEVYLVEPGVQDRISFRRPRGNDSYEHLGRQVRAQQCDLLDRLSKSTYNSRAWTYQERLLSRRCLYFLENMVYFSCRKTINAENKFAPFTHDTAQIRPLTLFSADPIFSGNPSQFHRTLFAIYARVVKEYTTKKLSYERDVMDAFSGIMAAMSKICGWRFLEGLPESLLDFALLWTPNVHSASRLGSDRRFPSWSWSMRTGEVNYDTMMRDQPGFEDFFADTLTAVSSWDVHNPDGFYRLQTTLQMIPLIKELEEPETPLSPGFRQTLQRESKLRAHPVLVFTALTRIFDPKVIKISQPKRLRDWFSETLDIPGKHELEFIWTWIRWESQGGTFYVADPDELSFATTSGYELVILSVSKREGRDFDDWDSLLRWNVMLIKWEGIFAKRIAVGYTSNSLGDFKDPTFNAKWKRIVLV
jgi:hypothetical protein